MEHDFKKIFSFLKSERLTENERIQMRNVLKSVIRENPVRASGGFSTRYEGILSIFNSHSLRPAGFALVFVLVAGIGTSYAADGALPGDPLYAVKVGFSEPVQGVLAVSPVAQAQWNTELISRRLEEAATLAAKGTLNDSARTQIEQQIALRSVSVDQNVEKIRKGSDGEIAASAVESDLEASLVGHERVLTGLSIDLPKEAQAIAPLLHKVREKSEETNTKRKSSERSLDDGSDQVKNAATNQKKAAEENVKKLRALAASRRIQASTTVEASTSASHIEAAIVEGDRKFREGKYRDALTTFQATIRAARAVEVNIDADERLAPDVAASQTETSPESDD